MSRSEAPDAKPRPPAPSHASVERAGLLLGLSGESRRLRLAVCCDFDGVIADPDLCNATLEQFGDPRWIEVERRWLNGEMPSHQALREQFETVSATEDDLARFFDSAPVAHGFPRFVKRTRERGGLLVVLSDGLDIYISRVMRRLGLHDVPFFANHAERVGGRISLTFPFSDFDCDRCGVCKLSFVMALKRSAEIVVYIGDGLSDVCASRCADIVYAKDHLARVRAEEDLPFRPFEGFDRVSADLDSLVRPL